MRRTVSGIFWILFYLFVVLAPMFLMMVRPTPPGRDFWVELSLALGFIGLTQMAIQFALIARFRHVTAPYGIDIILQYHRQIAMVATGLIIAHPAILMVRNPSLLGLLNPFGGTWASRSGLASIVSLLLIVLLSVFRKQVKLDYETWRVTHSLLSINALVFAQVHVSLAGAYINTAWKQALWIALSVLMVGLLVYLRLLRPMMLRRKPYRVNEVRAERGDTYTLCLRADGHDGMRFEPGQFAWVRIENPLTIEEHPFSFSSSAEKVGQLEFGIKELGDFTSTIKDIPPDTRVYLDGPHGAFSVDREPAAGYVFIAGGIGVTPVLSSLKTMADRKDKRPVLLFYANKSLEVAAYYEDLEKLKERMDLTIVYALSTLPDEERDDVEEGYIDKEMLERHLPDEGIRREYFICGPGVMMDAVQDALVDHGVPLAHIHSERFNLV